MIFYFYKKKLKIILLIVVYYLMFWEDWFNVVFYSIVWYIFVYINDLNILL